MRQGPSSTAVDDLGWLFGAAESEMGIRSNFPAGLYTLVTGKQPAAADARGLPSVDVFAVEDSAIAAIDAQKHTSRAHAAARLTRVLRRYSRLPRWAKVVLEAAYEARQLPPGLRGEVGQPQWALVLRRLGGGARCRGKAFDGKAKDEAVGMLERAIAAYEAT